MLFLVAPVIHLTTTPQKKEDKMSNNIKTKIITALEDIEGLEISPDYFEWSANGGDQTKKDIEIYEKLTPVLNLPKHCTDIKIKWGLNIPVTLTVTTILYD